MTLYLGIDLGTTNSSIASYDGEGTRTWRSPEQTEITPSAILLDRRGNKLVGRRAYDAAHLTGNRVAQLFKRYMGTSTPIQVGETTWTPEECSAEILRVLHGYRPPDLANEAIEGTVITVPAAFSVMQKEATLAAAELAGIGRVALMQEPVAAVMSVLRSRANDGTFLVYDIGGGTLDIAIAESISGRVSLLAHGGIAMCGGRDVDRLIVDNVVKPWLAEQFNLPSEQLSGIRGVISWSAEKAKIDLSTYEDAAIALSEDELRLRDKDGKELYLDIPLSRARLDELIMPFLEETITAARETLRDGGLQPHDIERIVFVGGPTHSASLRDHVSRELGIPASTEVNPMTAVAEGAAVFAESVDWSQESRSRKSASGSLATLPGLDVTLKYQARTPDAHAQLVVNASADLPAGLEFQVDSLDTGWSSGRLLFQRGAVLQLPLARKGANKFKVFAFSPSGESIRLTDSAVEITRAAASVEAIPASHSIGLEVLEKLGGRPGLAYIVRKGDSLPKKGSIALRAAEALRAGAPHSLQFRIWEGEIEDPIPDNQFMGLFKVSGTDLAEGLIPAGAEMICEFEAQDSGRLLLSVTVPSVEAVFGSHHNYYSGSEGHLDYSRMAPALVEEAEATSERVAYLEDVVGEDELADIRACVTNASELDPQSSDPELNKKASDELKNAKRKLAELKTTHRRSLRQVELEQLENFWDSAVSQHARSSEEEAFQNLVRTAQRAIDSEDASFEHYLSELRGRFFEVLWRQDWFVVERFNSAAAHPYLYTDRERFADLEKQGRAALEKDDISALRQVVAELSSIRAGSPDEDDLQATVNVVRG